MEVYATPPPSVGRSSSSPDSTKVDQQSYVHGPWSACLGQHIGGDDFQHYALHSSRAMGSLRQQTASAQSPPRSWNSPEQLCPSPWEPATDEFQNHYSRLDPQLSGLHLKDDASYSCGVPTSFPADTMPMVLGQSFDGSDSGYQPSPRAGYPSPDSLQPLSPCSSTLGLALEEDLPSPPGGTDNLSDFQASHEAGAEGHSPYAKGSPKRAGGGGGGGRADGGNSKQEEPYAQLIHRAFLSTPRHAMTLQEIYQWFRENTDKGKDDNKGWQNSIRHNLSMNLAFTKRERRLSNGRDGGVSGKGSSNSGDSKKSTEWYLEPWAVSGVQSTTRYRKGNQSRRSHGSHSMSARGYRGYGVQQHSGRRRAGGSGSGIQTGRMRGRSMPLPSSSSSIGSANVAAATSAPTSAQLHQLAYHFPAHHHQHHQQPQPFFDHQHAQLLAATTTTTHAYSYPSSYPYPYPFPSPSNSTTSNNSANANGTTLLDHHPAAAGHPTGPLDYDYDYDYDCDYNPNPNPYVCGGDYDYDYPAAAAALAAAAGGAPTSSESAGDEREPVTPEPPAGAGGMLMLAAGSVQQQQQQQHQQVPVATTRLPARLGASRGGGGQQGLRETVVGVFDEVGGDGRMGMEMEVDGWLGVVGNGCVGAEEAGVYGPPY